MLAERFRGWMDGLSTITLSYLMYRDADIASLLYANIDTGDSVFRTIHLLKFAVQRYHLLNIETDQVVGAHRKHSTRRSSPLTMIQPPRR